MDDVPLLSETRYEDLSPGRRWGPFTEALGQETADALRGALGAGTAGRHAPPGVLPLVTLRVLRRALSGIPPGGVLVRHHLALVGVLVPERELSVEVWVSAQDARPSGLYTTFTFTVAQGGVLAATVDWTILAPPASAPP